MRIGLDKTRVQALLIALPILLVVAGGLYYYLFLRPAYGISHEPWLAPDTAVRAVFKPTLVQSYVSSLAPTGSRFVPGVPKVSSLQRMAFRSEWVHKMPLEFSLLFDQRSPEHFGVLLFVQEHPTAESFDSLVNDSGFFQAMHPIRWEQRRMARQGLGQLIAPGVLPIPAGTRDAVSARWPEYAPVDAPAVTGRHFIEIAVNNRNGALLELQGALARAVQPWADAGLERRLAALWTHIESVGLTADLEKADTLIFTVEVHCVDGEGAAEAAGALEEAAHGVARFLESRHGFALMGAAIRNGAVVRAEYVFSGFEASLRRALGG